MPREMQDFLRTLCFFVIFVGALVVFFRRTNIRAVILQGKIPKTTAEREAATYRAVRVAGLRKLVVVIDPHKI